MSKQVNYNENLCAGAAIRDDKGRRISKLFESPHPKMTVGYAKNLIMPDDPTEQEFNFRQAGGGVIEDGVAVIDKVKGNSVVWNQIIAKPYTFGNDRQFTFSSWFNGGSCSINDKGQFTFITNGGTNGVGNSLNITPKNTHKYLLSYKVKADIASVCTVYKNATSNVIANIAEADKWYFVSYIGSNDDTTNYCSYLNTVVAANSPETTVTIDDAQVTDLTQMFGAGNEPTTYEEFLQRKPKVADEYAYNEGTIVNNKVEKVVTTGRNLWDEQCETSQNEITSKNFNPIIPGVSIYVKCPANSEIRLNWYDANKEYVSYYYTHNVESQVPANAHYFKILTYQYGTTYNHDICINLSDTSINGQYFPYEKHELDLSWVKEIKDAEGVKLFEDGMRSAGTAFDEVGKNKAVKRIGSVDLGTLEWLYYTTGGNLYFMANKMPSAMPKIDENGANTLYNLVCPKYKTATWASIYRNEGDKLIGIYHNEKSFVVFDSAYTDATAFKAAMSGVMLYYELAEPIEVEYDEKSLTYPVVAGGTEEAIASEPSSAFRADIGYGIDAVKTILDLKARVEALEGK